MRVVYADLAFFLNAALNYLTLCCTVRLFGLPIRHLRLAAAAALGGIYAVLALLPGWTLLGTAAGKCLMALWMVWIVFGCGKYFLRRYLLFLAVSCTLSGAVVAVEAILLSTDSPWVVFLVSGGFCAFVLAVVFFRGAAAVPGLVRARISLGGRSVTLTLFRDTGNTLRDPKSGQVVCVVWAEALTPLLLGQSLPRYTVPYQSLGQSAGALEVFRCDTLTIDGRTFRHYPIGLSPHPLSDGGGFVGLWGGEQEGARDYDPSLAAKST
ncbi:MAG: hypothetical protein HFF60_07560 [Oscillospiraceae bacterium]|nr:hypothetical protein [Oscillospiraceae bacterium]MCI9587810.1 hypothetical protein [Oscillospiraceae bacterium]